MNGTKTLLLLLAVLIFFQATPQKAFAQDEGSPALQTVAFFSIGGGAAGAGFGIALWLLDPLNPSADLTNLALQGFAAGSLIGIVLGIMQLQRQMLLPPIQDQYQGPSEFEGNVLRYREEQVFSDFMTAGKPSSPSLPLASFQIRF